MFWKIIKTNPILLNTDIHNSIFGRYASLRSFSMRCVTQDLHELFFFSLFFLNIFFIYFYFRWAYIIGSALMGITSLIRTKADWHMYEVNRKVYFPLGYSIVGATIFTYLYIFFTFYLVKFYFLNFWKFWVRPKNRIPSFYHQEYLYLAVILNERFNFNSI